MQASAGGPGITILGTVAMAPQSLGIVLPAAENTEAQAQTVISRFNIDLTKGNLDHLAMLYGGQMAAQRNLQLSDVFSDSAIPVIRQLMQNICIHELSASLDYTYGQAAATVPHIMHRLYWEQACKNGACVSRQQLPGNNTHFSTPGVAEPFDVPWIADRFAGKAMANGCPWMPLSRPVLPVACRSAWPDRCCGFHQSF